MGNVMQWTLSENAQVLVLTGAGVSAESGVPTFRGMDGLWEGHAVQQVASPEGFYADPALVWRFYSLRREAGLKVKPNPGHEAIAALERQLGDRFLLATQNVDGLHQAAGSERVIPMHGELYKSRCEHCETPFYDESTYFEPPLPTCDDCGGKIRPHIVWFGEGLESSHLTRIDQFIRKAGKNLVFLAVGTSGVVYPAAGLVDVARRFGGKTWLVDLDPAREAYARYDHVIKGKSGEVLPKLFAI